MWQVAENIFTHNRMCYRFERHTFDIPGNFETCIDATYVLIMEGSPREDQIKKQVEQANITSTIIYQWNKGYKNCEKNLRVRKPNYDLEHALKNAFKHALRQGYKRIMVLEDDCEFCHRVRNPVIYDDVCRFIKKNNPDIYTFGSFFPIINPLGTSNHQRLFFNAGSHCIIYNEKYMKWLLKNNCLLGHVDLETNRHWSKFTYKLPLAYQKAESTENTREGFGWNITFPILNNLIFKPTGIDKIVQPGYDHIKILSDIFVVLICIWILSHFR